MGLLVSRFRKKRNAEEKLEDLTQNIQKIEEFLECDEDKLRVHVRQLVIYSAIIYVFILCTCFLLDQINVKYVAFIVILFPLTIFLIRKFIIHYYKWKIVRNKKKIDIYKKEKQTILDDVMETEIYKVAKRILEKYNVPYSAKKFTPPKPSTPIPIPKPTSGAVTPYQPSAVNSDLRRRTSRDIFFSQNQSQLISAQRPAPPTLVRPVIPQSKGVFDKILEKFVGDGPNERYALICQNCSSHNGMALQEEFMYLSYRCVFCGYFNPAKKHRPVIPIVTNLIAIDGGSDSDSSCERKPRLQITELEDSGSESKEDLHDGGKGGSGDGSSPSQSEDSPAHKQNKETEVIGESETNDKVVNSETNRDNQDNKENVSSSPNKESKVEETKEAQEVEMNTEYDQVSPMEVDEDTEHPCATTETTKDS